jgi:hypothetical protein
MKDMMGVIRINPFIKVDQECDGDVTYTGEPARPHEQEPEEFSWELPGYDDTGSANLRATSDGLEALIRFSPEKEERYINHKAPKRGIVITAFSIIDSYSNYRGARSFSSTTRIHASRLI